MKNYGRVEIFTKKTKERHSKKAPTDITLQWPFSGSTWRLILKNWEEGLQKNSGTAGNLKTNLEQTLKDERQSVDKN